MKSWKSALPIVACCLALALSAGAQPAAEGKAPATTPAGERSPALTEPAAATEQAPEKFRVRMETTKGPFVIEVNRAWAPQGADRFYNLVKIGFFEDIAFFRVIPDFMAQFGIHGDPVVARAWNGATIQDDPVVESNARGFVTYAKTNAPNSRSTQFFINFKDNSMLDRMGFAPFGKVVEGMEVVDAIYQVGEGFPSGPGPRQGLIQSQGNAYLKEKYPQLDYIERATIVE